MPSCLVKYCNSWTGRKKMNESVILHVFPKNIVRIKEWLMQSEQYSFEEIDALSIKILSCKKNDNYRICSKHFSSDSYITIGVKKVLTPTAVPTLFGPDVSQMSLSTGSLKSSGAETNVLLSGTSKTKTKNTFKSADCSKRFTDASTQTDSDQTAQFPDFLWRQADPETVVKDHSYSCFHSTPIKSRKYRNEAASIPDSITPIKTTYPLHSAFQSQHEMPIACENLDTDVENDTDISTVNDPNDSDFIVGQDTLEHISLEEMNSTFESIAPSIEKTIIDERKFIVFESCLDSLFYKVKCQASKTCHCLVSRFRKRTEGSFLSVVGYCEVGHRFKLFESQPKLNTYCSGNILLSAAVLFSGSNINKIHEFLDVFGVQQISQRTFFRYQRKFLFQAVHHFWQKERTQIRQQIGNQPVALAGDGQCDSPGFSAKYCTYSFIDLASDKIVDYEIVQRSETTSSPAMENLAFTRCLDRVLNDKIDVCIVATDKHPTIKKQLESEKYNINHQLDVWHYAKNVKKKLIAASRRKQCKVLGLWVETIIRHFWWCIRNCQGDQDMLREMWLSLLHHIVNIHTWRGCKKYPKCTHANLTMDQCQSKEWLVKDSAAYLMLSGIVTNPILIKDLKNLVNNCHTGILECYHSKILKYRTKRIHFTMDSMIARTSLAALSHNFNTNREQAVVTRKTMGGAEVGEKRTNLVFPRSRNRWVVRTVFEKTSNEHIFILLEDLLNVVQGKLQTTYVSVTDTMPKHLTTVEKPDKSAAVLQHRSRF